MLVTEIYNGQGLGNQLACYVTTKVLALDKGFDFGVLNPHKFKCLDFMDLDFGKKVEGGLIPYEGAPPITLPNGKVVTNYTITLTFRRAADLEPGMPTAPAKLSTQSTAVQTAPATPLDKINEFYNGLTQEQKDKLGNLDDLIAEYNDVPFDYAVEDYIESIKCKL